MNCDADLFEYSHHLATQSALSRVALRDEATTRANNRVQPMVAMTMLALLLR